MSNLTTRLSIRTLIIACLFPALVHAEMTPKAAQVHELLEKISQEGGKSVPDNVLVGIAVNDMGGTFEKRRPSFGALRNVIGSDWSDALHDLSEVAPSDGKKAMLILALADLSPDDYLAAADLILDDYKEKPFNPYLLNTVLFPERSSVKDILAFNYKDPRVRALIEKARPLFAGIAADTGNPELFDVTLSGKSLESAKAYRADFPELFVNHPPPIASAAGGQSQASGSDRVGQKGSGANTAISFSSPGNGGGGGSTLYIGIAALLALAAGGLAFALRKRKG